MLKIFAIILLTIVTGFALAQDLPDNSVYHFESNWLNQESESVVLPDLAGNIQLVAFIYSYCEHTCPVIITRIKSIVKALSGDSQDNTIVTLVTLDPERDTVERVREYMKAKDLDEKKWQILVGSPDDVLTLSALFDVRYKPMGESDIAHSNVITLVDQQGVIRMQLKGLGQSPDGMIEMVEKLNRD